MKAKYISPEFMVIGMEISPMMDNSVPEGNEDDGYRPDIGQAKSSEDASFYDGWEDDNKTNDASTNW